MQLIKIYIIVGLILVTPHITHSACSWVGNTGTAANATRTEVAACITAAAGKSGAVTVVIPTGSQFWSSELYVDMSAGWSAGDLTIQGAGTASTTISGNWISVNTKAGKKLTIKDMTVSAVNSNVISGNTSPANGGGFRITNINFSDMSGGGQVQIFGDPVYGVIDNCTFTNPIVAIHVREDQSTGAGNISWAKGASLGNSNAVYIENNTFSCNGEHEVIDSENGGRYVVRYNTFTGGCSVGMHDVASGGNSRSILSWEIYNNSFSYTFPVTGAVRLRGGTGVVFNNTVTQSSSFYIAPITMTLYRACGSQSANPWITNCSVNASNKACIGSNIWCNACSTEGNCSGSKVGRASTICMAIDGTGPNGYPCRDQIGQADSFGTLLPARFWNNTSNGQITNPVVYNSSTNRTECANSATFTADNYIRVNRDYCQSATTMPETCNGIATTYNSYTYPHPLISGASPTIQPPSGFRIEGQ
jgi:hypothetical protein